MVPQFSETPASFNFTLLAARKHPLDAAGPALTGQPPWQAIAVPHRPNNRLADLNAWTDTITQAAGQAEEF